MAFRRDDATAKFGVCFVSGELLQVWLTGTEAPGLCRSEIVGTMNSAGGRVNKADELRTKVREQLLQVQYLDHLRHPGNVQHPLQMLPLNAQQLVFLRARPLPQYILRRDPLQPDSDLVVADRWAVSGNVREAAASIGQLSRPLINLSGMLGRIEPKPPPIHRRNRRHGIPLQSI